MGAVSGGAGSIEEDVDDVPLISLCGTVCLTCRELILVFTTGVLAGRCVTRAK